MSKIWTLLAISLFFAPLAGCTSDDDDGPVIFPTFSAVADNDEVYDNTQEWMGVHSSLSSLPNGAITHATQVCIRYGQLNP